MNDTCGSVFVCTNRDQCDRGWSFEDRHLPRVRKGAWPIVFGTWLKLRLWVNFTHSEREILIEFQKLGLKVFRHPCDSRDGGRFCFDGAFIFSG